MKKALFCVILLICIPFCSCSVRDDSPQIAATTMPVYEFTTRICKGTDISVTQIITESVSCLHDYTLQPTQMRTVESADYIVISGAGLEEFLSDILSKNTIIDASSGISLLCSEVEHEHRQDGEHNHSEDPHIWLSPANAKIMATNICNGLISAYPEYNETFENNLSSLIKDLDALEAYAKNALNQLSRRDIITFHDGFAYMAEYFDLTILHAIEEESGSEASAAELIQLINIIDRHQLTAIFTESNGSTSAAEIIRAETGVDIYSLDMCISGDHYFDAMYHNIDTIKEALE